MVLSVYSNMLLFTIVIESIDVLLRLLCLGVLTVFSSISLLLTGVVLRSTGINVDVRSFGILGIIVVLGFTGCSLHVGLNLLILM